MPDGPSTSRRQRLLELAGLFLKLGCTAFGGPAAHIAMLEDEVVRRRGWLTAPEFLDLLGATNLIPGPNSTEMAIHIGARRAGFPGLLVAGVCFITPAAAIVSLIAWVYVEYGSLPAAERVLYGIKPVMIAVVLQALVRLGRTALRSPALGVHELAVLLGGGVATVALRPRAEARTGAAGLLPLAPVAGVAPLAAAALPGVGPVFLIFLKIGSVLFGSGYVLLAFLREDFVVRRGWLTEGQLLDAVAVGQFTPGPVFTTATFIGYVLKGLPGAAAATVGIFLPAFVFVALSGPLVPRIRRSAAAGRFLDGVNAASLALMAVVAAQLGRAAIVDWVTGVLAVGAALVLARWRVNSAWLVLAGAAAGGGVWLIRR